MIKRMNNVSLLIAPLGARHQREQIFHRLAARCPDHDYSRVLYIGPNVSFLSSITKLFCSHLARTGTTSYIPFRTSTIEQLGASLHELHGQNELIPDEIRTLILLSLINEHNLGYARLLSGLLSKIKHYLPDSSLADIIDKLGQLIVEEKARDRACNAYARMSFFQQWPCKLRIVPPHLNLATC